MTEFEKRQKIKALIKKHTQENTVSRARARECLIEEGIYTKKGELKVTYGGVRKKAESAA